MTGKSIADHVRDLIRKDGGTQSQFAQSIGLDGPKLSKSLAGVRRFTSLDLARIAAYCGTTVDVLLGSEPAAQIAARAAMPLRSDAVDSAVAAARRYAQARADLTFLNGPRPEPRRFRAGPGKMTEQGHALAVAAMAALPTEKLIEQRDLATVIESTFNVDVGIVELPQGFDGLAWSDDNIQLIIVGTSRQPGRQRFTMAHELGHLLAGDDQGLHIDEDVYDAAQRTDLTEMRANAFAAAFLMPEALLSESLKARPVVTKDFAEMSSRLSVSPSSLAWRLFNLDIIDESQRAALGSMTTAKAAAIAGQSWDFMGWIADTGKVRRPTQIINETLRTYLDGKATLRPAAALLDMDLDDLRAALEGDFDVSALVQ